MRRTRIIIVLIALCMAALALAPDAFAAASGNGVGGGQGWYGETTDRSITNVMFLVIIFFPTVIVVFSLIQGRLDKRKHARMDAVKRRAANTDWRGGW